MGGNGTLDGASSRLERLVIPTRLSIVTYNLWSAERWPDRAPALQRFLALFDPDILAVQELHPLTQAFLDERLATHARVADPFEGWSSESNLYWKRAHFELVAHGAEPVGHPEPHRRLFWVRLRSRASTSTLFVATAHLTTARRAEEAETGASPRVGQLRRIVDALGRLVLPTEPAFFMGDMNDPWHPQRILRDAGYASCFAALGQQSPPTFHSYPTANIAPGEHSVSEAIDLIAANDRARAIAAGSPQVFAGDLSPSDHWPVHAVYEIGGRF